jgi:hypothetical protein
LRRPPAAALTCINRAGAALPALIEVKLPRLARV